MLVLLVWSVVLALVVGLWVGRDRWLGLVASDNPFQATPAEFFAVGAEGIVLPEARAVDGWSTREVADALDKVKRALAASYLDPQLLKSHDPAAVLGLLAPDSVETVRTRLEEGGYGTALIRVGRDASLAGTPRVSGKLTYRQVDWNGRPALDVTSNYVFAYAFDQPRGVVVVHAETHWMFPKGADIRPSSRGMYLGRTTGYWHGMDCALAARGFTGPAGGGQDAAAQYQPGDAQDAYFDPTQPVGVASACR
ncbi:hypothetical protein GCM10023321_44380 [Pseudonocardia eucalypti]|uniref:Lipoprotein n=1 Tax=Pseudonocardia eucalypti TaxID=648755 RepID=A0ABP9QFB1_9PSEU|nr:hypothetical protein [Pseudonocardia eucalypti]